jgi:hypothetical protein
VLILREAVNDLQAVIKQTIYHWNRFRTDVAALKCGGKKSRGGAEGTLLDEEAHQLGRKC